MWPGCGPVQTVPCLSACVVVQRQAGGPTFACSLWTLTNLSHMARVPGACVRGCHAMPRRAWVLSSACVCRHGGCVPGNLHVLYMSCSPCPGCASLDPTGHQQALIAFARGIRTSTCQHVAASELLFGRLHAIRCAMHGAVTIDVLATECCVWHCSVWTLDQKASDPGLIVQSSLRWLQARHVCLCPVWKFLWTCGS